MSDESKYYGELVDERVKKATMNTSFADISLLMMRMMILSFGVLISLNDDF
ncbi:hypothetical protein [Campylobacter devanensis]|uniref:hypothetical protein n=1 Tax=Campylobacter devanensis TaxID=3161138 RepID=UPI001F177EEB|nr:hypothetical protein [Campylobacter sp. P0111]